MNFAELRQFLWVWVRVDIRGRYIGYIGILPPGYLGDMVADVATIGPDGVPVGDGIFGPGDAVDGLGRGPGIRVRRAQGQADLIPVPDPRPGFGFWKVDAQGNLIVTVKNQGTADAGASTLKVEFLPGGTCTLAVPPILLRVGLLTLDRAFSQPLVSTLIAISGLRSIPTTM